ncbi:MAG: energy transducer TonB [Terriglobales bacterium]|jgi:protein TonB
MLNTPMFSTLESTWDHSARRRWTTLASFTMQVFGLSLLIAISLLWVERPPLVHWLQFTAPAPFTPTVPAPEPPARQHFTAATVSNMRDGKLIAYRVIPPHAAVIDDAKMGPIAPDLPGIDFRQGRGPSDSVPYALEDMPVVIPVRPTPVRPLVVSHLAEANLIFRVQPVYPSLARLARIQGPVELRAIVGKAGTIENLVVVRGHPMLVSAAIAAVRQWRYRPYLLNGEPIAVETEITVNFVLSGI